MDPTTPTGDIQDIAARHKSLGVAWSHRRSQPRPPTEKASGMEVLEGGCLSRQLLGDCLCRSEYMGTQAVFYWPFRTEPHSSDFEGNTIFTVGLEATQEGHYDFTEKISCFSRYRLVHTNDNFFLIKRTDALSTVDT